MVDWRAQLRVIGCLEAPGDRLPTGPGAKRSGPAAAGARSELWDPPGRTGGIAFAAEPSPLPPLQNPHKMPIAPR